MPLSSNGIETHKDGLTIHFTIEELHETIDKLISIPIEDARTVLDVGDDGRDWSLSKAIKSLQTMVNRGMKETRITYRPFDVRFTMLNSESGGFIAYPRWDVMSNLVTFPGNLGLVTARLMARGGHWDSCLATRNPTEKKTGDSTRSSTIFPFLVVSSDSLHFQSENIRPNLSFRLINEIRKVCRRTAKPRVEIDEAFNVFSYLFSLLHSPEYRERYQENLKTAFPRLPLPRNQELFLSLTSLGTDLIALHLMESPKLDNQITKWQGKIPSGEIKKVTYLDNTVWIDKANSEGYHGVPENVWNFHIGGYQICHKWLKDRKGRQLSKNDIEHYQKIVVALNETIRLMAEIDNVINAHGGWPAAFQTGSVVESRSFESEPFEYLKAAEDQTEFSKK